MDIESPRPASHEPDQDLDGDSSDVVTGPVGDARLIEPSKAESLGADLDELPMVGTDEDEPADQARPAD